MDLIRFLLAIASKPGAIEWLGMGNQALVDYFSTYAAVKARHSYGPQGHRGMSVLIFEASASGYLQAERLHKHFAEEGTDKDTWFGNCRILFLPGCNRQLYGYLATKEDLEFFNRHCQGLENRVVKEKKHAKPLKESFGIEVAKDNG
ncbi:protein SUPPRESSOR OF GENE SILENCING 3 homolog isoform X2 [Cicer arietinum]|uniref:Protein SUPPRESSOR OF GENE SILENCING 3 homolog isoform X2 n=1 Tax=Cicer arietinum TaxID=3827 RepID=A0A1S2Z868_CICAR|nr:protein SUPPRESSOR OF GENE SILENCING 3 homolog isoform X2 [Cicer arietinum]XP_027187141.1 protein SUPPRESSOR OF GENE SILENCING 3 homolog isoform X2 [Cicer arietinum]